VAVSNHLLNLFQADIVDRLVIDKQFDLIETQG